MGFFTSFRMTRLFMMAGVFVVACSVASLLVSRMHFMILAGMCAVVVTELSCGKNGYEYGKAYEHGNAFPTVVTRSFTSFRMTRRMFRMIRLI